MKVFALTSEFNSKNGWGRYSLDIVSALGREEVKCTIVTSRGSINESKIPAISVLPDPDNYYRNYFMAVWYAWRLRKFARDCDVVHSFIESYSSIAYWLSRFTGKKYFVTTHGSYGVMPFRLPRHLRYFHKKSFASAKKVLCVSDYTKKRLAEYGLRNLLVINNGIDFERFYRIPMPAYEDREDIVLSVGALKYRKGQHISLHAFAKAQKTFAGSRYVIVGDRTDEDYFKSLKKMADDLHINDNVDFVSSISDEELMGLYKKAKVFILTSISKGTHFEGFGLVYLEANACGLPVIGSSNSGAEDAIKDGETGFLVEQKNSEAAADAIEKLLGKKELWKKMSENSIVWAGEHEWGKIIKRYIEMYHSA